VKFSLPEVKRGLIPATISPYVVQAMGVQAARRYFITGETFTAEKAYELGMVHELTTPDTLDAKLESILGELDSLRARCHGGVQKLVRDVSRSPTAHREAETAKAHRG